PPMFTGSSGSYNTTTTDSSSDSATDHLERNEPVVVLPIAAKVDELAAGAAQHELAASPRATARHLVHDQVDSRRNGQDVDRDSISRADAFPPRVGRGADRVSDRPNPHAIAAKLRDQHPRRDPTIASEIQLNAVAIDVG